MYLEIRNTQEENGKRYSEYSASTDPHWRGVVIQGLWGLQPEYYPSDHWEVMAVSMTDNKYMKFHTST